VAVASAGPYANHVHLTPDRWPRQHLITQFLTGRMLFLKTNQQCQSTEGKLIHNIANNRADRLTHKQTDRHTDKETDRQIQSNITSRVNVQGLHSHSHETMGRFTKRHVSLPPTSSSYILSFRACLDQLTKWSMVVTSSTADRDQWSWSKAPPSVAQ